MDILDKKTEKYLERLARKNATQDIAEVNRKKIRNNFIGRSSIQDAKALEEEQDRQRFFNEMRRREF